MRVVGLYLMMFALTAIMALVIAEAMLRLTGFSSELHYRPNPYFGWSHQPDARFTKTSVANTKVPIQINSKGLRDLEYGYEKPASASRILVLGDSFAEAFQVPLQASFAKQLEGRVAVGESGRGYSVIAEVINSGASGYGTDNALLFFSHEGYKYDPDLVLLAFYVGNDVRNNWHDLEIIDAGGDRKPYFTFGADGLSLQSYPFEAHRSLVTRLKVFLKTHLRLYAFLRQIRDRIRHAASERRAVEESGVPLDLGLFARERPEPWGDALRMTEALLLELDHRVRSADAQLFVVLIPTEFQVHRAVWDKTLLDLPALADLAWDLDGPNRVLGRFLADNRIAFVDLLPAFRARATASGETFYLHGDGHWNAAGHALAAGLIGEAMQQQGLAHFPDPADRPSPYPSPIARDLACPLSAQGIFPTRQYTPVLPRCKNPLCEQCPLRDLRESVTDRG
ncbi:MAG: hypothetical protein KJO82_08830 [Gammaproteobacteria bacterium]|nr:hypothetical protein [Gammaproteobacteria bacterium]